LKHSQEEGMGRRVTLELSDEILERAERLAVLAHRDVTQVLTEAISAVLPPVDLVSKGNSPVSELSDEQVLRLADLRLAAPQERRLSELLDRQQAGTLMQAERMDLLSLMQIYEANWLRQAEALREAVRRGLREPLSP
jgi:hypothetical protein